jgi:hypothetical protein
VEVLFANKQQRAMMVCGEGGNIRVLIADKVVENYRNHAPVSEWREFSSGRAGGVTDEPRSCRYLTPDSTTRFIATLGNNPGILKVEQGKEPVRIVSGVFNNLMLVTPDGKWLVAVKMLDEAGNRAPQLIRHDLQTGQDFPVIMPRDGFRYPATYVRAHGKVLLGRPQEGVEVRFDGHYALLDPETGKVQLVKGEFRPLENNGLRSLQPTENPHEFWAAIYDPRKKCTSFGRYDSKNFSFTPLIELSELQLTSDDIWADAAAGKIWITYQGHLLRAPMPAKTR